MSDLGHKSDKFIYEYCLFFVEKERKKQRYEVDKVKEVALTEWMRLAAPAIELGFNLAMDDPLFAKFINIKCWVCEKSWAIDLLSLFCNIH